MAKAKKITAALTAALLCTASLTSCSDTSYVMTAGDSKINAGIYIYNELTEMSYQMTMMYYQNGIKKDYFDQKVDGKAFDEYLSDYKQHMGFSGRVLRVRGYLQGICKACTQRLENEGRAF